MLSGCADSRRRRDRDNASQAPAPAARPAPAQPLRFHLRAALFGRGRGHRAGNHRGRQVGGGPALFGRGRNA